MIEVNKQTDMVGVQMYQTYMSSRDQSVVGDSNPCSICRAHPELKGKRIHVHGSDVGACPRKTYFSMVQGNQLKPAGLKAVFLADGHLHEAQMLEALASNRQFHIMQPKNSKELRMEVPVIEDGPDFKAFFAKPQGIPSQDVFANVRKFSIIGHCDGWIEYATNPNNIRAYIDEYPPDSNPNTVLRFQTNETEVALIECKSVTDYTWKEVKEGRIKEEWYGQMQYYMWALALKKSYLLVKHRGSSDMLQPILISFDSDWLLNRLRLLLLIYKCVNKQQPIPIPKTKNAKDGECKFCPFNNQCW